MKNIKKTANKQMVSYRLDVDIISEMEKEKKATRLSETALVEEAVIYYLTTGGKDKMEQLRRKVLSGKDVKMEKRLKRLLATT